MSKKNAMRAARNAMTSGYKHHSLDCMQQKLDAMIKENEKVDYDEIDIHTYADVLAPTRFRGMKNGLICFVTIISRAAIKNGVENELSFALSDYYVNEIELQANEIKLNELKNEIIEIYVELVQKARSGGHSLQIMRAIRYMHLHIY